MIALLAAPSSASSSVPVGLNEGGSWDWDVIGHSGADYVRATFAWSMVTEHGSDWRTSPAAWEPVLDVKVREGAEKGIPILALLSGRNTPGAKDEYYLASEQPAWTQYQEFVWTAVQRYGRHGFFWKEHPNVPYVPITVWEVWNEPNNNLYSPGTTPLPQKYAEFLIATSNTIKGAQNVILEPGEPTATVLHGGLLWQGDMSVTEFIDKASKISGYGTAFDGFGLHPYAHTGATVAARVQKVKERVKAANEKLKSTGSIGAKPIWITEIGWAAAGTGGEGYAPVTEAQQAELLRQTFSWAANAPYNVAEITWYNYRDSAPLSPLQGWDRYTGLRRFDGSFRPSWIAFQEQTGAAPWPGGEMAFQSNGGSLITEFTLAGGSATEQGMAAGTSPSITKLKSGSAGYQAAFQANKGLLYIWGPEGYGSLGQGMAAGTSPSIGGLSGGGYEVAFQANNSQLITVGTGGNVNWGLGMAAGTSPSIAALEGGGYQAAMQANNSQLWMAGSAGVQNWGLGMAAGTSPSITALEGGGYEIAFQANNSQLWTVGTAGNHNWGLGMAAGTSPSIVGLPGGGYEVAFQSNGGELWTVGSVGNANWGKSMRSGTSPSIAWLPWGGIQVAFQNNLGTLETIGPGIAADTGQGMAATTSPDIAP